MDDDGSVGPLTWAAFFEADVVEAKITAPVSQINTKADPTREKDIPAPEKGNPGTRFVGFGIQLEVNGLLSSRNTLGGEIVAYTDKYVLPEGRPWYQPYIFFYGGYSASSDDLMNIILNLAGKPSALTSPATLANMLPHKVTASLCVFAIFGNETFLEPDDYAGAFTGGSLTVKHIKGYVAVCSTCTAVGVGYDMQFAGCGVSETYFVMVDPNVVADKFKELMQEAFGITQTIDNKAVA